MNKKATKYYNTAKLIAEKGNYSEAVILFTKAIETEPNYAEAYYNRANSKSELNDFIGAKNDYIKAINIKPEFVKAYCNLGIVYMDEENINEAILNFNKALKINKNFAIAFFNRGIAYGKLNQFDQAIKDYKKVIELQLDDNNLIFSAYNNIAFVQIRQKQYPETVESFSKAIELKPNSANLYYLRAKGYGLMHNNIKALEDFNEAIKLNPKSYDFYVNRASINVKLDNIESAIKDYSSAVKLNNSIASVYYLRAGLYMSSENFLSASEDLKTALKIEPENVDFKNELENVNQIIDKINKKNKKKLLYFKDLTGVGTIKCNECGNSSELHVSTHGHSMVFDDDDSGRWISSGVDGYQCELCGVFETKQSENAVSNFQKRKRAEIDKIIKETQHYCSCGGEFVWKEIDLELYYSDKSTHGNTGYHCMKCSKFEFLDDVKIVAKKIKEVLEKYKVKPKKYYCDCGGEFKRNEPIFCPNCKSTDISYNMSYIT